MPARGRRDGGIPDPDEAVAHLAALIGPIPFAAEAAGQLIDGFGSAADVLAAHRSGRTEGMVSTDVLERLDLIAVAVSHLLSSRVRRLELLATVEDLSDYLRVDMGYDGRERFRVLFLDGCGKLIADEIMFDGTIDRVHADPRKIVFRGLQLEASKLLLVHNHPSGSPDPSRGDISFTQSTHRLTSSLGMPVVDHIVVTRGGCSSMRQLGIFNE